jgi:hypothetical protein
MYVFLYVNYVKLFVICKVYFSYVLSIFFTHDCSLEWAVSTIPHCIGHWSFRIFQINVILMNTRTFGHWDAFSL